MTLPALASMSREELEAELAVSRRRLAAFEWRAAKAINDAEVYDGVRIQVALHAAQWKQVHLADGLPITRSAVSLWCLGKRKLSKARALEVAMFFEINGAMPPVWEGLNDGSPSDDRLEPTAFGGGG